MCVCVLLFVSLDPKQRNCAKVGESLYFLFQKKKKGGEQNKTEEVSASRNSV